MHPHINCSVWNLSALPNSLYDVFSWAEFLTFNIFQLSTYAFMGGNFCGSSNKLPSCGNLRKSLHLLDLAKWTVSSDIQMKSWFADILKFHTLVNLFSKGECMTKGWQLSILVNNSIWKKTFHLFSIERAFEHRHHYIVLILLQNSKNTDTN